jgi:hypothetical protein
MHVRMSRSFALGTALAAAAVLGGCTPSPPAPSSLRIVTTGFPDLSGRTALLEGTLQIDDDGCLRVKTRGDLVTLVWPRDYTVTGSEDAFEIRNADDEVVVRSGSPIALGGGVTETVQATWDEADCATGSLWAAGDIATR